MEPHLPYTPTEEFQSRFLPRDADPTVVRDSRLLSSGRPTAEVATGRLRIDAERWRVLSGLYNAEIATLDAEIRRLVGRLEEIGAMRDTILVVLVCIPPFGIGVELFVRGLRDGRRRMEGARGA